eukprot:jgi/Mesvir1/16036/Mv08332-RA.1
MYYCTIGSMNPLHAVAIFASLVALLALFAVRYAGDSSVRRALRESAEERMAVLDAQIADSDARVRERIDRIEARTGRYWKDTASAWWVHAMKKQADGARAERKALSKKSRKGLFGFAAS